MVDFYGFKNKDTMSVDELANIVGRRVMERTNYPEHTIAPYIQMHEFEGLLFSDVNAFNVVEGVDSDTIRKLNSIRSSYNTPEDINDNKLTAPSKRIAGVLHRYTKVVDGLKIAEKTGLETIRSVCTI